MGGLLGCSWGWGALGGRGGRCASVVLNEVGALKTNCAVKERLDPQKRSWRGRGSSKGVWVALRKGAYPAPSLEPGDPLVQAMFCEWGQER